MNNNKLSSHCKPELHRKEKGKNGRTYNVYRYHQIYYPGNWTGGTTDSFGAVSFQLNDLANVSAFTSLYDQYRLVKVEVLMYHNQLYNAADSGNTIKNHLWVAADHDDVTAWTSSSQAFQYQDVEHLCFNESGSKTIRPRVALAAYNGTFVGYANMPESTWLDCATANVQHYGVKYCIQASSTSTANTSWKVFFKYFVEFRQVI
jgi:hypothetical protein